MRNRPREGLGFTLFELLTGLLVLSILASLVFPLYSNFQSKAQRLKCRENIQTIGLGISSYLADHQRWPQIQPESSRVSASADSIEATHWINILAPYGVAELNWRCPSIESQMRGTGKKEALKIKRIDYAPTAFGPDPDAPRRWPKHPWLVERGAPHGIGPWILLSDGSIITFEDMFTN